jgi:hypothetical protein
MKPIGLRHGTFWPTNRVRRTLISATVSLGLVLGGIARAHHGFVGRYDLAAPVWIEGIVVQAYFGYPHSEFTIRVRDDIVLPSPPPDLGPAGKFLDAQALMIPDNIRGGIVKLELPPTRQYSTLGDRIRKGDAISAVALRNCDPPHQFNVQWLRLPNGGVESRATAMSYMVKGC